jgi:hypothetical protein
LDWLTYFLVLDCFRGNDGTLDGLRSGRFGLLLNEVCNHRIHVVFVTVLRRRSSFVFILGVLLSDVLLITGMWLVCIHGDSLRGALDLAYLASSNVGGDLSIAGLASRQSFIQERLDIRQYALHFNAMD